MSYFFEDVPDIFIFSVFLLFLLRINLFTVYILRFKAQRTSLYASNSCEHLSSEITSFFPALHILITRILL